MTTSQLIKSINNTVQRYPDITIFFHSFYSRFGENVLALILAQNMCFHLILRAFLILI
jgi:hypothetical protein